RTVVGGGDGEQDLLAGQGRVDLVPADRHVVAAVDPRRDRPVDMLRRQFEAAATAARGKDNSVIAEHDLADIGDTILPARFDLGRTDGTAGIGNVDRVVTDSLAELAQATARAARAD